MMFSALYFGLALIEIVGIKANLKWQQSENIENSLNHLPEPFISIGRQLYHFQLQKRPPHFYQRVQMIPTNKYIKSISIEFERYIFWDE